MLSEEGDSIFFFTEQGLRNRTPRSTITFSYSKYDLTSQKIVDSGSSSFQSEEVPPAEQFEWLTDSDQLRQSNQAVAWLKWGEYLHSKVAFVRFEYKSINGGTFILDKQPVYDSVACFAQWNDMLVYSKDDIT